jgi:hypothetical protein
MSAQVRSFNYTVIRGKDYTTGCPQISKKKCPQIRKKRKKLGVIDPPEAFSAPQNAQFCS